MVAWRRRHGFSQRAAAEHIGISQPALHGYENGKPPSAPMLQRLIAKTDGAIAPEDYALTDEAFALRRAKRAARTVRSARDDESGAVLDPDAKAAG